MNNNIYKDIYDKEHEELFLNKHKDSFIAGYLMNEPEAREKMVKDDKRVTLIGYILILSVFVNIYQASLPQRDILKASYSDDNRTIQALTTLNSPVNTVPLIIKWAENSVTNALTFGFYNYDKHLKEIRPLFTSAGYAGFVNVLDSNVKDTILENKMDVITIPSDTPIMSHMYSKKEPYWIVQVPVTITYTVGVASKDLNHKVILVLKIVPVSGIENQNGKEIDSIQILTT